ncbi:MAG: vitamin K epoxide reductase family protein [Streptosporangiaceae bacterium]
MTASKSSRARNARAGAQVGATGGGTAVTNGSAARSGSASRNSGANRNSGASRNGAANRNGTVTKDGGRDQARTAVARNGAAERGARTQTLPDKATSAGPAVWLQLTTFALALADLGVSIYLTIAHFTESALLGCSESGLVNCTKVTTSPQSYVFGIPVAVLGLAFFVFAVAIMSPWAWRAARREIHLLRIASLVVGMGFVLYLLYAELFTIGSICLYCTSVHAITFVLFVLTMAAAAIWGLKPGVAWKPRLTRQPDM